MEGRRGEKGENGEKGEKVAHGGGVRSVGELEVEQEPCALEQPLRMALPTTPRRLYPAIGVGGEASPRHLVNVS